MPYKSTVRARENSRVKNGQKRAARIAAGLCTRCGKCPPADGRRECEPCAEKRLKRERERYAERIARGQCRRDGCHKAALPGLHSCAEHTITERAGEGRNRRARAAYWARRRAGLCTACGAPAPSGASRCEPCAARSHGNALHREARNGYQPGAGYAGHDGTEAFSMPETWEAFAG